MAKLYGSLSSRAHRTAWMLKELGIEFEHEPTNFLDGSTRSPEFLKVNPNGRVPAYEADGLRLFESLAINLYLARKHQSPLSPASLEEDALMTQWTHWVMTEIEKPLLLASANLLLFDEHKRSPAEFEVALNKLARPFAVLEQHLSEHKYLVGDRFTVADLNVSAVMTLIRLASLDMTAWPNVDAWLDDCLERPAAADWKAIRFKIPRPDSDLGVLAMFV
ncbi:glutathione S-transferase family protein [Roseibium litorale]|uniref:Glutathione S-transferase family protein n=1 Tax=Roseibium litorale TaxID=2803841 RepID=A0ABR9CMZ1_9HYPH|nr:glutathione S-transferase family protein [Roseibium litorale]MBD8892202.1 glutathione S-transferase family protein [Roseibium litorale]